MKRVFETNDGRALRVCARDLDGILDGFGAGIEENRFLGKLARGQGIQFLRHGNVALVRSDSETKVQMLFELRLNRGDHARRTMADIQATDAAGKIQIAVAARADGAAIEDVDGNRYLDFAGGKNQIAVAV